LVITHSFKIHFQEYWQVTDNSTFLLEQAFQICYYWAAKKGRRSSLIVFINEVIEQGKTYGW
jgi:hypothetical protein